MRLHSNGRLQPCLQILNQQEGDKNTLAYYNMATITANEFFTAQTPDWRNLADKNLPNKLAPRHTHQNGAQHNYAHQKDAQHYDTHQNDAQHNDAQHMTLIKMTLSIMTLSMMTLSVMTLSVMTLNIMTLSMTIWHAILDLKKISQLPRNLILYF
jgi:hypothetical protein